MLKKCIICDRGFKARGPKKTCSNNCQKEKNRRYNCKYERSPERHRAQQREYRRNNPEPNRRRATEWYRNNREKHYENSRTWAKKNPEKVLERGRKWRAKNQERQLENERRQRSKPSNRALRYIRKYQIEDPIHLMKAHEWFLTNPTGTPDMNELLQ